MPETKPVVCLLIDGSQGDNDRQSALVKLQHKLVMALHGEGLSTSVPYFYEAAFITPDSVDRPTLTEAIESAGVLVAMANSPQNPNILIALNIGIGQQIPVIIFREDNAPPDEFRELSFLHQITIPSLDCLSDIRTAVTTIVESILDILKKESGSGES